MINIEYNRLQNRIDIRLNPPETGVIAFIKRHFAARDFDRVTRAWWVPLQDGQALRVKVNEFTRFLDREKLQYILSPDVNDAIDIIESIKQNNINLSRGCGVPAPVNQKVLLDKFPSMTPAMIQTADYLWGNNAGVINGDPSHHDPRLTTWAAVETLGGWLPSLILCSESDKWTWGMLVKKTTRRNVLILGDEQKVYREITGDIEPGKSRADVCIHNFGNLEKYQDWLCSVPWKSVIVDGGHHIKHGRSPQALIILDLVKNIDRRFMLSQTDYMRFPYQLVPQLDIINRLDELGGHLKFLERYNNGYYQRLPGGEVKEGIGDPCNVQELDEKLRSLCLVRHE